MPYIKPGPKYPDSWNKLRFYIFGRDNYICQICGKKISHPHCHHIIPIGIGGTNHPRNLQTLCKLCHKKVHNIKD